MFSETKKKEILSQQTPLWMSDDVEFWPEPHVKFIHIAQMYSELVALSSTGQLYQWKWNEQEPFKHPIEVSVNFSKKEFLINSFFQF